MHDTAGLRTRIIQAFDDQDLKIFCYDHFRSVYENITVGMSKSMMVQLLIEYCVRNNETNQLLEKLHNERPNLFAAAPSKQLKPMAYVYRKGVNLEAKDAEYNIIYAANIIDSHVDDIEAQIGTTDDIDIRNIGSGEEIPEGGETRWYNYRKYLLSINYNKQGIAKGMRIEGFEDEGYSLGDWFTVLHRMGVSIGKEPDQLAIMSVAWSNYHGYRVSVALNRVDGVVNIARIYQIPRVNK